MGELLGRALEKAIARTGAEGGIEMVAEGGAEQFMHELVPRATVGAQDGGAAAVAYNAGGTARPLAETATVDAATIKQQTRLIKAESKLAANTGVGAGIRRAGQGALMTAGGAVGTKYLVYDPMFDKVNRGVQYGVNQADKARQSVEDGLKGANEKFEKQKQKALQVAQEQKQKALQIPGELAGRMDDTISGVQDSIADGVSGVQGAIGAAASGMTGSLTGSLESTAKQAMAVLLVGVGLYAAFEVYSMYSNFRTVAAWVR